jgi:hypothetical protein
MTTEFAVVAQPVGADEVLAEVHPQPAKREAVGLLAELASPLEKVFLYLVLSLIIGGIAYALFVIGGTAGANYQKGLNLAHHAYASRRTSANVSPVYILQLSRAYDAVALKGAALFLGYVIVVLGCIFVLKGVEASYRLRLANAAAKSALETSSPGLVLIRALGFS